MASSKLNNWEEEIQVLNSFLLYVGSLKVVVMGARVWSSEEYVGEG